MSVRADLHVHTRASDGDLEPQEVVVEACSRGLDAVAVTDHDTVAGVTRALEASRGAGIQVVPGVEISAVFDPGTLHLLGYFSTLPAGFEQALEPLQKARETRCPRIVEKLRRLGIEISEDDVLAVAGEAQVGRPHIARILVDKGYVRDFGEAFSRYLAKDRPAYVHKEKMEPGHAVGTIRAHGGLPVLAHPFTLDLDRAGFEGLVRRLVGYGLAGIEINYPEHTVAQMRLYAEAAREHGLLVTGGSDYHGPRRNSVRIGDFGLDARGLEEFRERLSRAASR